jgi:hypothetical protein
MNKKLWTLAVVGVIGVSGTAWADERSDAERFARRFEDQAEQFLDDVGRLPRNFTGAADLRSGAAQLQRLASSLHGGLHQGAPAGSLYRTATQADQVVARLTATLDQVMTILPHGPQFAPDPVRSRLRQQVDRMDRTLHDLQAELRQWARPVNNHPGGGYGRPGYGHPGRPVYTRPVVVVPPAYPGRPVQYRGSQVTIRIGG